MKFKFSLLFFMVFVLAISVNADTLTFNTLPSNTQDNTYNGFAGVLDNTTSTTLSLICDDFSHTTYFPSGPLDYATSTIPTLANVRFVGASFLDTLYNYEVAAVLVGGRKEDR